MIRIRKDKGLGLKSVRTMESCMKAQVNKEVILSCSRDAAVRRVASARREAEQLIDAKWNPAVRLDLVVERVTYRHRFKGQ